jgi:hypothetical protein
MSDQYGLSAQYPQQSLQPVAAPAHAPTYGASQSAPAMTASPSQSGYAAGFGPAALVAMVFVVLAIMFATIPRNQFFVNQLPAAYSQLPVVDVDGLTPLGNTTVSAP